MHGRHTMHVVVLSLPGGCYVGIRDDVLSDLSAGLLWSSARKRRACVALLVLLFGLLLTLGMLVCQRHLQSVAMQPLPFVWLSRRLGSGGYLLVALCLYAAALSTLCAMLCAMANLLPRGLKTIARLILSALLCAALARVGFGRIVQSGYPMLGALCAAAMLARVSFLERSSGDYEIYLADWLQKLAGGSFAEGMRQNIGEYNVLYQYILFVITRLPVPSLYAVKAVSFIGDAFLAGAAATLAQKDGKKSAAAFGLALLLPTVALNGGMFAQCDSLYAACALWGLALALERKPAGAACFALSLAFKLQAVFLLPVVAVLWADRKLRLSDALVFLAALAATALPALLGGKSIGALLSIYTAQTGLYTGLTYNAPSFFALMNTTGLDVYAYGNFGMALAFGACALLIACGVKQAGRLTREGYLRLALLLPLAIVFFLPRMHERYFYLADILSAVLAAKDKKAAPICALVALASLGSYWETALPLSFCALMMFAALILTLRHTQREENVI